MSRLQFKGFKAKEDKNSDDIALAIKENEPKSYEKHVNNLSLVNVWVDIGLKIVCLIFLFWVIGYNLCHIYAILQIQFRLNSVNRLDPVTLQALIKYGLFGYNALFLLIFGYWFNKDGAFMKNLHRLRYAYNFKKGE